MRIIGPTIFLIAICNAAMAREVVSLDNEFGVMRDFSAIALSVEESSKARVFVDTEGFVVNTLSASDNAKLRQIAFTRLSSKLTLVNSKQEANYLIQIRMGQNPNYAIRNLRQEYSRGFVMISMCKFPIKNISSDCENLQYDYFRKRNAAEVFSAALDIWIKKTFPTM